MRVLDEVPRLSVQPGVVEACAGALLAASAQVDDLGTFVRGAARVGGWTGRGAAAYDASCADLGRVADALSLALREVARRLDEHAPRMTALVARREALIAERQRLAVRLETAGVPAAAQADRLRVDLAQWQTQLAAWCADLDAEERAMAAAFDRVLTLDRAARRYAGRSDPADAALASLPGADDGPAERADDAAAWWAGLSPVAQAAVIAAAPGAVGNLDGAPARARARANEVRLARDLADWQLLEERGLLTDEERDWLATARAAEEALRYIGARPDPRGAGPVPAQLYLYDPAAFDGDGRVAVAAGDLDTADDVVVLVPGFGTDARSAPTHAERVATVYDAARHLDGDRAHAALAWVGYDAPDNLPWRGEGLDGLGAVTERAAGAGGERLSEAVAGLRESRDGVPAHLTVVGYSYGSTTAARGAHDHGLAADDLVLVGSPGAGGETDHATETRLDPDHVWVATNSRDPVARLGNHGWVHGETLLGAGLGDDPAEDDFGARRFRAESTSRGHLPSFDQHTHYFDHRTESLANLARIVTGDYAAVEAAPGIHDPWWGPPQDGEADRPPAEPVTDQATAFEVPVRPAPAWRRPHW